jgi:hypothetical protein
MHGREGKEVKDCFRYWEFGSSGAGENIPKSLKIELDFGGCVWYISRQLGGGL